MLCWVGLSILNFLSQKISKFFGRLLVYQLPVISPVPRVYERETGRVLNREGLVRDVDIMCVSFRPARAKGLG